MSDKVLIIGGNGMVGHALARQLGERALCAGRAQLDLLDEDIAARLSQLYRSQPFRAVINAAAYTQVDKAESEDPRALLRVNAGAVGEIAAWCRGKGVKLVHFSTDYVFDGGGTQPRGEASPTAPLNAYGASKLAGEQAVAAAGGDYLIFRVCWIFDARGKNFFTTIRRLLKEKESLSIVADQTGAPTYAPHLARAVADALDHASRLPEFPTGIYHLCSEGETSWHGFAHAIFEMEKKRGPEFACTRITPIPTEQYPLPAKRPHNSRMDCSRAAQMLGVRLPHWKDGLEECFKALSVPA